mgnify:CR=1 FL=1
MTIWIGETARGSEPRKPSLKTQSRKGYKMNTQKKCWELVKDKLKSRISDLTKLWALYLEDREKSDENLGNMYEYGLSFDYVAPNTFEKQRRGYFRYQLSWGGPADEFRIYAAYDLKPYTIQYWYMDWFDGAGKILYGKDFKLIAEIFEMFFVDSSTAQEAYKKAIKE